MALKTWIASSWVRHYPLTPAPRPSALKLEIARNERISFQVGMRLNEDRQRVRVEVDVPKGCSARVRRVGYVPVRHHNRTLLTDALETDGLGYTPGFVPDPLFDEDEMLLPQNETHTFWVTLQPGRNIRAGLHTITVRIIPERGRRQVQKVSLRVHRIQLPKRKDFAVTHWFYVDALMDGHQTDMFDRRFWEVLPNYFRNISTHGQDTITVPAFTLPLDGVKRPSQLVRVHRTGKDAYRFDFRDVKKYIDLARRNGLSKFEWGHFFTQWGVKHALRIYEGQGRDAKLLWPPATGATSKTYRLFLAQFLPKLDRFLSDEGLHKRSYFHVSDEPHGFEHLENYKKARALLRELAPWMKVMDALTEIEFAHQGLTDMPVPSIRKALDFVEADIPCWCYYCCGPRDRFLNHLLDTPLAKMAMHGMLLYRWPFKGFLHWGYNYWYRSQTSQMIDPFTVQDGDAWKTGWAYGDTFLVYPGPDGPIDSIRWEVFGECMQDYRLLQALNVARNDALLRPLKNFEQFPKVESWRKAARAKLFQRAHKR